MALMQRRRERQVCRDTYAEGVSLIRQIACEHIYFFYQEEKKILYYYPEKDLDVQIKNIGLSEAIIKFTEYVLQLYICMRNILTKEYITDLSILDSHVIIAIHTKHVRYIISQSLISGW